MERVVLTIGGSILAPPTLDETRLRAVTDMIVDLSTKQRLLVVVGGGNPARRYIQAARSLRAGESELDRIGVAATRLNAQLLACLLHARGVATNLEIPHTVSDAVAASEAGHPVVVMGGTTPGHSTDFVGAELAVASDANRLVIVTNVNGIYTRDPRKDPTAQYKPQLTFEELLQIIEEKEWTTAGAPGVIDGPATLVIATHGVPTCVVSGEDASNVAAAARGEAFEGTMVSGEKVVLS